MEKLYKCTTYFTFFLCLFGLQAIKAQPRFGNEWIDTTQSYLRIPVAETGIYKVTFSELRKAGFPIDSFPNHCLQLFRRGKETAIDIRETKSADTRDGYLLFFGERNDGAMDSVLYNPPAKMPHAYYSLYADTAVYFLTANKHDVAGKRMPLAAQAHSDGSVVKYRNQRLQLLTTDYPAGNLYPLGSNYENGTALSTYDTGEGWTGKAILPGLQQTFQLDLGHTTFDDDKIEIEVLLVGRSPGKHQVNLNLRAYPATRLLTSGVLMDYNTVKLKTSFFPDEVPANGQVSISVSNPDSSGTFSVSYIQWNFPEKLRLAENTNQKILFFDRSGNARTAVVPDCENWQFYDVSDPYAAKKLPVQDSLLSLNGAEKVIASVTPLKISKPELISFRHIDPLSDYLIVSHPLIRRPTAQSDDPVKAYAAYRSSAEGGNYHTLIRNSREVADQFNYGDPGPQGIRNLIAFLYAHAKLRFVLLLGRSIDPQTARHKANARDLDMIPNMGWPGSDITLAMHLKGNNDFNPIVPVGRVNAAAPSQVYDYLQKVKAVEKTAKNAPWRKNILHLGGGHTPAEREVYKTYLQSFERKIESLGMQVQTITKMSNDLYEVLPIYQNINQGVALITFYGHSNLTATDLELGLADDPDRNYQNDPLYPAVIVNGCTTGNSFYSANTISNNWILAPHSGAVLFLAHTHNGVSSAVKHYADAFYETLADTRFTSLSFGEIQIEAIRHNLLKYPTLSDRITAQQMNLQGDPAIRIFPATLPDYTWSGDHIRLSNPNGKILSAQTDPLGVIVGFANNGRFRQDSLIIKLARSNASNTLGEYRFTVKTKPVLDSLNFIVPNRNGRAGEEKWTFVIDPDHTITEEDKTNNTLETIITLEESPVSEILEVTDVTVSPNPSGESFKFEIECSGTKPTAKWRISVFDKQGSKIHAKEIQLQLGRNEYLWLPENIAAGVYIYVLEVEDLHIKITDTARKNMRGEIVWMH